MIKINNDSVLIFYSNWMFVEIVRAARCFIHLHRKSFPFAISLRAEITATTRVFCLNVTTCVYLSDLLRLVRMKNFC